MERGGKRQLDYLIRNALIVDGTGRPPFAGDVALKHGLIAAVGDPVDPSGATRVIDGSDCILTPGFIDVHTHYDGQATWDDLLDPSSSHGVTTLVMGNCGVGFAPMRAGSRDALIDLMEGIEDIPGAVLTEGIAWGEWESFPQYLDFLDRRRFSLDVAAQIPHGALRLYVMGDRGARNEDATADDIREMAELTREAMEAGAVGLSSSRTQFHRSRRADLPPPGTYASSEEMTALAMAMADSGRGVLEVIPSGSIGTGEGKLDEYSNPLAEAQFFAQISHRTGVPVTFSTAQVPSAPNYWRDVLRYTVEANQRGAKLRPQIASRGVTVLHGLTGHHLFMHRPAYKRIAHLELAERVAKMREPACKQTILRDADDPMSVPDQVMNGLFRRSLGEPMLFPMGSPVDYEPAPETSISARIAASNADAESLLYDTLVEDGGRAFHMVLAANYVDGNLNATHQMILEPATVIGLGDGGAHVTFICDASYTTQALSHWAKRRTRGPLMSVENVVAKLTSVNADLYGMKDRGRIARGLRADINLINLDQLAVLPPYIVKDLPAGGSRLLQDASGYRATFVAGCMTRCNGEDTGQRPGRLLRSTRLS